MPAPRNRLSPLQVEILQAFFRHEDRVDPAEEIFANKLCTLLGRSEIRDLVDRLARLAHP